MGLFGRRIQEEPEQNAKETTLLYLSTLTPKEIDSLASTAKELRTMNQKIKAVCYNQPNENYGE